MMLASIKFNNSNRLYDYIVPADWRRKVKVGDLVVVPPSIVTNQSQVVEVLAINAKPKPHITYVELIGHVDKKTREAALKSKQAMEEAKRSIREAARIEMNKYPDYF